MLLGERVIRVGDAAVLAAALRDGIYDYRVVAAVAARVHENGALEPKLGLELLEAREGRVRRRVRAIRRVRIPVTGAEDVAMSVASARGRLEFRRARIRI